MGITVKKDQDISEWYTQVIQKAELADYTRVSGCIVFRPRSYAIWEKVQKFLDDKLKKSGVKNAYFPLFIPESLLCKEQEHVEGFTPEVAWVTHSGETKLAERLAVRPTSETIMYDSYSKWIRSHKDLPLRINQWCNVVRWEFKNPVPFLRTREFLWQEGHSCFATEQEADSEVLEILDYYDEIYRDVYAIPALKGRKSEKEKFAGAKYTTSLEIFLPNGKAIQGCTSHCLGQNFSKAFDISFLDENGSKQNVWQNSWGYTTRSIGIMIMMHGDDKGLIIPPYVAPTQIVIVPIYKEDAKEKVLKEANKLKEKLEKNFSVDIDLREEYTPGWKFNDHELKGIPLRIEIGPKDLEKEQCVLVTRHDRKKEFVKLHDIKDEVEKAMKRMHHDLYTKAKAHLDSSIVELETSNEFMKAIDEKKIAYAPWCGSKECEEMIKDETGGAKSLNIPFKQPKLKHGTRCFHCEEEAKYYAYFAKSY
ncbi:MAG: proline--tRNA ligase [Nanoarchaeota archaeon]|nr:proline--tRNA ligase [Nanoarchaeota archaeon]